MATAARDRPGATRAGGESRFGVFAVGPHLVGIPVAHLQEMFVLPAVHRRPGSPSRERGLTLLRGAALPAVDLRVCLGLTSAQAELEAMLTMLTQREQDHRDWIAELEASVRERRRFGLQTDPRKCRFGQWYYGFRTDDAVLRGELARIEAPHAAIHALGTRVEQLAAESRYEEAGGVIERGRSTVLRELLQLFDGIRQTVQRQHREIGVMIVVGDRRTILVVDRAEAVADLGRISEHDDPVASGQVRAELVASLASWGGAKQPVMVLDVDRI
jgi:chemotaxis signal transduction protein